MITRLLFTTSRSPGIVCLSACAAPIWSRRTSRGSAAASAGATRMPGTPASRTGAESGGRISADSRFGLDPGLGGPVPWENIGGRAEFITFSLDGSAGWNPLSWFEALRPNRAWTTLRPELRRQPHPLTRDKEAATGFHH